MPKYHISQRIKRRRTPVEKKLEQGLEESMAGYEFIGKVDHLLVSVDGKEPYAVLSVGGFLGMGTHLVVVPYDTLKFAEKQVMLPGGTKEGLRLLPEFKYATQ